MHPFSADQALTEIATDKEIGINPNLNRFRDMFDTYSGLILFVAKATFLSYCGYYLLVIWSLGEP